jgi:hypothetical protein
MIKKSLFLFFAVLVTQSPLIAGSGGIDGSDYMWTQDFGAGEKTSYNWIDIKDATGIFFGAIDNQLSSGITLPFTFYFYGKAQTTIYVSANGYVTFANQGTTTDPFATNVSIPSSSAPDSMIAPYWGQLSGLSSQQANVYVKTIGTAPFRQYVVQWDLPDGGSSVEFELILFEDSNNIKFQWAKMDVADPGSAETVGLQNTSADALEYSFNNTPATNAISEYSAVLFHGEGVNGVDAAISPSSVSTSTSQEFTYVFNNISPSSTDALGKVDSLAIAIPAAFTGTPTVTSIKINSGSAFIQNGSTKPTDRGFATWQVSSGNIIVQTADFEVIDSMIVKFIEQTPASVSTGNNFTSIYGARLDSTAGPLNALQDILGWTVDVTAAAGSVDYYAFTPANDTSLIAGNSLSYTITAYDQAGIPIANSDSVIVSASGSVTTTFSPRSTIGFGGTSTANVTVSDNVRGSFTLKAQKKTDASVTGTSGLVTVNPGNVDHINVISSTASIKAGTQRNLRVAVLDIFNNRVGMDSVITFSVTSGTGSFTGGATSITGNTTALGEVEALYTASITSGGSDVINVSFGAVNVDITLVVDPDNVSYYSFNPSTDQSFTAGGAGSSFTVTARDQYDNVVTSSDSVIFSAEGSGTATFSPNDSLTIASGTTVSVTVQDNTAGSFNIKATRLKNGAADATVNGTSGLFTVAVAAASSITEVSSSSAITAGGTRRLQVRVDDQYGNVISGAAVTFAINTGTGSFSGSNPATTDANGIAFIDYTASTTSGGNDVIDVTSVPATATQITLSVIADGVSYYSFNPSTDQSFTAGGAGSSFTVTARDQYDNVVTSSDSVIFSAEGSGTATFSPNDSLTIASGTTVSVTVQDNTAGSFNIKATRLKNGAADATVNGTSGLFTVAVAAASSITEVSSSSAITAGGTRRLQVRVDDQYGNVISGAAVTFAINTGTGSFSGSNPATTDANGIAFIDYTASTTSGGNDVIDVTSVPATATQITLSVIADGVSYYSFNPSTDQSFTAGGAGSSFTVTARDQYDNVVTSSDSVIFSAEGSGTATFSPNDSLTIASGTTVSVTVQDNTAGSFNIKATRLKNGAADATVNGTSGLFTVAVAAASSITEVSSSSAITAGGTRRLQVRVDDQYGNVISGAAVTFAINTGTGSFSGSNPATTDANGIAFIDYTASTTSGGNDVIDVTSVPATATQITLSVIADGVSYYSFNPSTDQSFTAGGAGSSFTVTARDQYDNVVTSSDSVIFSAEGSGTATFSPNDSLTIASGTTVSVTVQDNTAGSFNIKATRLKNGAADATVNGTSGLFTVAVAAASSITEVSSSSAITAGGTRRLQVRVDDQYGNVISGAAVTFAINTGTGSFSGSNPATTDANGIAFIDYTASTTSGGNDVIDVTSVPATATQITLSVVADGVSYYAFTPSTAQSVTAGASLQFTLTAKDQYDNDVTNSGSVNLSTQGSSSAVFSPVSPVTFSNSASLIFNVSDQTAGSFSVIAENTIDSGINGQSGLVTINPDVAAQFTIISSQANIVAGTDRLLQVGLEDQYGNRRKDGSTVTFTRFAGSGTFGGSNPTTDAIDANGVAEAIYTASTTSGADDSIQVSFNTVLDTIILPVVSGSLAEIRIQTTNVANGPELIDSTITADQTITAYAAGYDATGNFLGLVSSNWIGSGIIASGNLSPANPTSSITFTATNSGTGKITATDNAGGVVDDITGVITINAGTTISVLIMDAPGGTGTEITTPALTTGEVLNLYANGFDAGSNFSGNESVTWGVTGTLDVTDLSTTTGSSTIYVPTSNGSGTITTSSAFTDDATGTITVSVGALASLEIRTATGGGGVVLNDSTKAAGETLTLYAAGYDANGNYRQDESVTWTTEGDVIGTFGTGTAATSNVFTAETVNSGRIKITSGTINDYSGIVKVTAGTPTTLAAASSQSFAGTAANVLSDSLAVKLTDFYGNVVPGGTIAWTSTTNDGAILTPSSDPTDVIGISRSSWRLRNSSSAQKDTARATYTGLPPVEFIADVTASNADSLLIVSGDNQTSVVGTGLADFVVSVVDTNSNPVSGVVVTFSVTSTPSGATGYSLLNNSVTTGTNGQASTTLTLGDKVGTYEVTAFNANLITLDNVFTSTATVDAVNALSIFSGNGQSGTVATALTNNIIVKAVDQFGNAVSGTTVTWQPTTGGSINNLASTTTNAAGLDTVSWTLRTSSGPDTLLAILTGLDTVIYTASANAGAANSLAVLSGNNKTTVAGSNQKIEARVLDQFGNYVSGQNVSFLPAENMSALVSTSNDTGLVSAVYRAPSDQDSSIAQAVLASPADTASFKVYGVRYVSNSLSPKSTAAGATVAFSAKVTNPGPTPVLLNITKSTLVISDGTLTTSETLSTPSSLPANSTSTLQFNSAVIANFASGSYTPEITLVGSGVDTLMNGTLLTDAGELSISPLQIGTIQITSVPDSLIKVGSTISTIQMSVKNNGVNTIRGIVPTLSVSPTDFTETFLPLSSDPDSILTGQTNIYRFSMDIPGGTTLGLYTIDGSVTGTNLGEAVSDVGADQTEEFRTINSATLTWTDYSPQTVSEGQNVAFTTSVTNGGAFDIILDKNTTTLTFGADVFNLASNQTLEAGASTDLTFSPANLTILSNTYVGTLAMNGTETGNTISSTITTTAATLSDLTVQTVASLGYTSQTLSSATVSQGKTGESFTITVTNNGEASLKINAPDSIVVFVDGAEISTLSSDYSASLSSHAISDFPVTIANSASVSFIYTIDVNENATVATDVFSSRIAATDLNSSVTTRTFSSSNPSWDVLAKSALGITALSATATQVSQGQSGLTVDVTIQNTGSVASNVDSVYLDFLRNVNSFTHNATFPVTLAGGASTTIQFTVTIDANAATGLDSIRAITAGQNNSTFAALNTTSAYLDAWTVFDAAHIVINAVTSTTREVNRGQLGVPVKVTISNEGLGTVLVDNIQLTNLPANSTTDTRITAIDSITAGQTINYQFQSDILQTAADTVLLGAQFDGRDRISNAAVLETVAAIADTFFVGSPSTLRIDSVYAAFNSFSQGQDNLDVRVRVTNVGRSEAILDSVLLDLTGVDATNPNAGNTLSYSQVTVFEVAPFILPADQSTVILYRLNSSTASRDSGDVQIDARAYGTDRLNNNALTPDLSADAKKDTVLLQTPANPVVTQIFNAPASVTTGQTGINVNLRVKNQGSATARLENVLLNFFNGLNANKNGDYTRQYISPALPATLLGWDSVDVAYTIGVGDSAELGTMEMRGDAQSTELNRNLSISNTSSTLASWNVIGTGALEVLSVLPDRDSVSTGQQNVPVLVTIRNGGATSARVDSIALSISRGSYDSLYVLPAAILTSGQSAQYTINADVLSSSVSGVATLDASVYGVDLDNSQAISDANSDSTASWLVQQAVSISITENTPTQVSTNQIFIPKVTVVNSGEARLVIDTSATKLYAKNSPTNFVKLAVSSPGIVEANQTIRLIFNSFSTSVATVDSIKLELVGTENNDSYNNIHTGPDVLTVQSQAVMDIASTVAVADSVSQGEIEQVSIFIDNTAQAGLVVDSLVMIEYGNLNNLSPALPYTINGGLQQEFIATIDVNNTTATGDILLDVSGFGYDANNTSAAANDGSAATPDSWFVTSAPLVTVSRVTSVDTIVTQGQTGVLVDVTVRNDGQTPVLVTNMALLPQIGMYTQTWPAFNFRINGNDSVTMTTTIDVATNSATGTDSLFAQVDYQNIYSGSAIQLTGTAFHKWDVSGTPTVNIVSVETDPTSVSQGQGPVDVQVRVENIGTSAAVIDSVNLNFKNGSSNYLIGAVSPSLPFTLNAGLDRVFTIPVTLTGTTQTGLDSIFAQLNVTESVSQAKSVITDTRVNDSWRVQVRPLVTIDSVSVNPAQASSGQSGLIASVYVSNKDTVSVSRASAQLDSVRLVMKLASVERNDQFSINRTLIPSIPLVLQEGTNTRFDFDLDVNANALTGTYSADAYAESQDINDGTQSIHSAAILAGQLAIQTVAMLAVDTVWVVPDSISQGQTHGRIYVQISNNGQAAATINGSALSSPDLSDLQELFLGPATPFNLLGGTSDTLIYSFIASEVFNGLVRVNATVDGEDNNSGAALSATNANPTQFLIQTPASPSITSSTPNSSPGNELVQFRIKIVNSGEATIVLNPALTTITIGNTITLPLDATSPTVIAASPDTTELIFVADSLKSLSPGEHTLQVRLKGTTNKADYDNTLDAGSFAFGEGLIVITDIVFVDNSTLLQGAKDVRVNMLVSNSNAPLLIDSIATKPIFKLAGSEKFVQNLRRRTTDTLMVLPLNDSVLEFIFDIPDTYPIGTTDVSGHLSLDGGTLIITSGTLTTMVVESAAKASYVANTTTPDSVINSQKVSFQLSFQNTGTAGLALKQDSTYIEFPGFPGVPRRNLTGSFTLAGDSAITAITFSEIEIPATEPLGTQDIVWRVKGSMLNGDFYENSGTASSAFEIIPTADLAFNPISITETQVLRGQDTVQIDYTLENSGASDAIVTTMDFDFTNKGNSVKSQWINISTGLFPDTVTANSTKLFSVLYNVAQSADTGMVIPAPTVSFRDIRTQEITLTSSTITTNDQVEVIIPASLRIDSLYFAASGNTPNAPLVNDGQSFILAADITNNGAVNVATGLAILKKGFTAVDTVSISNLAAGSSTTLTFAKDSVLTIPSTDPVYSVTLQSLIDFAGNIVSVEQPLDNSEKVIIQNRRTLSINSSLDTLRVTKDQKFTISATISQGGASGFQPGSVTVVLPGNGNYTLASGESQNKTITPEILSATWEVIANAASAEDILSVQFSAVPIDDNTGLPVVVIKNKADIVVGVEEQGSILVSSFIKSAPVANNDTVSTAQQFELRAQISLNKMLQDTTATLNLPEGRGYSVVGASVKPVTGEFVTWQVVAPAQLPTQGANKDTFTVSVNGDDINTGETVSALSSGLVIFLEERATLSLSSQIISPQGAKDGILSTQQSFVLQTQVANSGDAAFGTGGSILLEAHGGLLFTDNGDSTLVLNNFDTAVINKTLTVSSNPGSGSISSSIQTIPNDENSLAPALVKIDQARNNVQVRQRANLVLQIDKTGAAANQVTRATGQAFQIMALVRNNGFADVDTSGGRHFLVLDTTGTGIRLSDGETARKSVKIDSTTIWNVNGPAVEGIKIFFIAPENNKHPLDENENISAFRSVAAQRDSLSIDFIEVKDIVLDAKFGNGFDSLIVAINQEEIFVEAKINFDPQLDLVKNVELILPQDGGYSIQEGNLVTDISLDSLSKKVVWKIKAPEVAGTVFDSLTIRVFGKSSQGFDKTTEQKLAIKTVSIARLALQLSIDKPDGATDGEVSEGQAFRLKGVVINREDESPVSDTGEVQLTTFNTQFFSLIDTVENGLVIDASTTRVFKVDSVFYWWVRATSETPLSVSSLFKKGNKPVLSAKKGRDAEVIELSVNQKISKRNKILKTFQSINATRAAGESIVATITRVPDDDRLKKTAQVENYTDEQNVKVVKAAFIKIASTTAPDKISTGQVFTYTVTAGERSSNLLSPEAVFFLPESFASDNSLTIPVPVNEVTGKASININVPIDYTGFPKDTLKVVLSGVDKNTSQSSTQSLIQSDVVEIQIRPDVEISSTIVSPVSAVSKQQLSFGQELQIQVWADLAETTSLLAYADLAGEGVISLDTEKLFAEGFTLASGENADKSFTLLGQENALLWRIIAPQNSVNSSITFNFTTKPKDANSGSEVFSGKPSTTPYAILVRQKEIVLRANNNLVSSASFVQGQNNLPLLAFEISNSGYGDSLFVDSLAIGFHKAGDDPLEENLLDAAALVKMFAKLKVVNAQYFLEGLGKISATNVAEIYADITVDNSSPNAFGLEFQKELRIAPDSVVTIVITADVKADAIIQSFRSKLEDITIFDVNNTIKLLPVNNDGLDFIGASESASEPQVVVSSNVDKSFYIYPNPFGRGQTADERIAYFNVYLKEPSEVTIRVYTLLGELVWNSQTKTLTGAHSRQFSWDGKNNNGKRVLNGAYIGVMESKPTAGGSIKRAIIKIAYIK